MNDHAEPIDARIRILIAQLDSLLDGASAAARLAACGAAAREPLRLFLIDGRPRGVYQPRLWAVQALSGIGADDVLIEYLRAPIASDAVARLGEEVVRSAAARLLAGSPAAGVDGVLFTAAAVEHLPGALEALASRDPAGALPILAAALGDDFTRETAERALREMGEDARGALVAAVLDAGNGAAGAIRRRCAALDLLAGIGVDEEQWTVLAAAVDDPAWQVACAAAGVGASLTREPGAMAQRLIDLLPRVDAEMLIEVENLIVHCMRRAGSREPLHAPPTNPGVAHAASIMLTWKNICRRVAELHRVDPPAPPGSSDP